MLNIKNPVAYDLAKRLARTTGRNMTSAVVYALTEQLRREEWRCAAPSLSADLVEIGKRCAALPDVDLRSEAEALEYNEFGGFGS